MFGSRDLAAFDLYKTKSSSPVCAKEVQNGSVSSSSREEYRQVALPVAAAVGARSLADEILRLLDKPEVARLQQPIGHPLELLALSLQSFLHLSHGARIL